MRASGSMTDQLEWEYNTQTLGQTTHGRPNDKGSFQGWKGSRSKKKKITQGYKAYGLKRDMIAQGYEA